MQHPFLLDDITNSTPLLGNKLSINEYLLIVQPHEDLYNKIVGIKQQFAAKYDCPTAMHTKPHISLVNFLQWEMQEKKMLQALDNTIARASPFMVKMDGFGSFPTHTIYANIASQNDIVSLVKSLRPIQSLLQINTKHKAHFITAPHLTIARKLLPWQYEKAWLEYAHTPLTASFMVNEVILLKRHIDTKKYNIASQFSLVSKPFQVTTQASLFS